MHEPLRPETVQESLYKKDELEELVNLVALGAIKPVVHRIFELEDIQDAHKLIEEGKAIGKIVIIT